MKVWAKMDTINLKSISGNHFVSGQIQIDDMKGIAYFGIKLIINNRPDNEEFNQINIEGILFQF